MTITPKIPVYVGHKLSGAAEEFLERMRVTFLYVFASVQNCVRIEFLGKGWTDPKEVYKTDIEEGMGSARIAVLVLDERSDGVIIELCAAVWKFGIPTLVIYKQGTELSGLVRGLLANFTDRIVVREYSNPNDIVNYLIEMIDTFDLQSDKPVAFESIRTLKDPTLSNLPPGFAEEVPLYKRE